MSDQLFHRYAPLEDITVRAEGDGRTVEALAAVFNRTQEVQDWEGTYTEAIRPGAFQRTIGQKGTKGFQVLFNHGMTIFGTPAERYAMPVGVPQEVREDTRGLVTVVRYSETALGDEVLQLIKDEAIKGYSFAGKWVKSEEDNTRGAGAKRHVWRTEVDMREFGPTPFPVYKAARVLQVRSAFGLAREDLSVADLVEALRGTLDDAQRSELATMLAGEAPASTPPAPASTTPDDSDLYARALRLRAQ